MRDDMLDFHNLLYLILMAHHYYEEDEEERGWGGGGVSHPTQWIDPPLVWIAQWKTKLCK